METIGTDQGVRELAQSGRIGCKNRFHLFGYGIYFPTAPRVL
jgi:hypothetical protein